MRKLVVSLGMVLLMVSASLAGGYETRIVFIPKEDEQTLQKLAMLHLEYKKEGAGFFIANVKMRRLTYDINEVTRDGWEIKTSRVVWSDFNMNNKPDDFEWGTEYTLQRQITLPGEGK